MAAKNLYYSFCDTPINAEIQRFLVFEVDKPTPSNAVVSQELAEKIAFELLGKPVCEIDSAIEEFADIPKQRKIGTVISSMIESGKLSVEIASDLPIKNQSVRLAGLHLCSSSGRLLDFSPSFVASINP